MAGLKEKPQCNSVFPFVNMVLSNGWACVAGKEGSNVLGCALKLFTEVSEAEMCTGWFNKVPELRRLTLNQSLHPGLCFTRKGTHESQQTEGTFK